MQAACETPVSYTHLDVYKRQPSGLAGLMGIGAEPVEPGQDLLAEAKTIKETEAKGGRDTGRPGLKAYILEK